MFNSKMKTFFIHLVLFLILNLNSLTCAQKTNIGLLYESDNPDMEKIFNMAIEKANENADGFQLHGISVAIEPGNAFETSKKLCKMLKQNLVAVFGPSTATAAKHAASICDAKELPFVDTRWDFKAQLPTINLHPNPVQLALMLKDMVNAFEWKPFTILYESGEYLQIVHELLKMYDPNGPTVTVRHYELDLNGNYRNVLRRVRNSEDDCIVIVGSMNTLPELLKQAQQVGLLTKEYYYIIYNLDLQTSDLEPYQHSDTDISICRLVSPLNEQVVEVSKALYETEEPFKNVSCPVTVSMALVYDGVQLLAETLKQVKFKPVPLSCNDDSSWDKGYTLVNYMKSLSMQGLSGEIKFDNQGLRSDFTIELAELTVSGVQKYGKWHRETGYLEDREEPPPPPPVDTRSLVNKTFTVITAISEPYGMLKQSVEKLEGNDQFEGFGIDLIDELSKKLGFKYNFILHPNDKYGSCNKTTGECNGMLAEVVNGRADLAITDLTMTSDRESGVDFTIPFMNLGISILFRKPQKEPPKLFSFMAPFSGEVWLALAIAYFSVSTSMFILGRISPTEWDNPYPCIEDPTELENQFSFPNCMWFAVGALLQQGSELAPKAYSTRAVASFWSFFTLILVSSYTANLAAFLTVEPLKTPIENVEDLAAQKGGVKYGAKAQGATYKFFEGSNFPLYQKMYEFMKNNPKLMTDGNPPGVIRVENENYAFLMESTTIEYTTERRCGLTQVGKLLDEKGYGIAMRKNWGYRDMLSKAILELQEQGVLTKMKTKWWKEKRGGGACPVTSSEGGAVALKVANLGGVFLVFILGSAFAALVAVLEMLLGVYSLSREYKQEKSESAARLAFANLGGVFLVWGVGSGIACLIGLFEWFLSVYMTTRRNKVPLKAELIDELHFILQCSGNTKAVKYPPKSGRSSRASSASRFKGSTMSVDSIPLDRSKVHALNEQDEIAVTKRR